MIQLKKISNAVYLASDAIVYVGPAEVRYLKDRVMQSERKRIRICVHKSEEDPLQEMFIVASRESYIQPSKHVHKAESMHVIEGSADLIIFDETGRIAEVIEMGDPLSGRPFFFRTPESAYHSMLIRSELLVYHESTQGPFRRNDTVFPPWAPDEHDPAAVRAYLAKLSADAAQFQQLKNAQVTK